MSTMRKRFNFNYTQGSLCMLDFIAALRKRGLEHTLNGFVVQVDCSAGNMIELVELYEKLYYDREVRV